MEPKKLEPNDYIELDSKSIVQWCWAKEMLLDVIETRRAISVDKYKDLAKVLRMHLTTRTLQDIKEWCDDNQTRVDRAIDDNIQMVEVDELISFLEGKHGA